MTKFSVTKNGEPLSKELYTWNEKAKTFSTNENGLVLDFTGIYNVTFNTGSACTFKTDKNCFVTRYDVKGCTEIPQYKTIKLNDFGVSGYSIIKELKNKKTT